MSAPFTKEDIDKVIKRIPVNKAPRPDGFNGCFTKTLWENIAPEFYKLCQEFAEGEAFFSASIIP
jgi:hypothetical protein